MYLWNTINDLWNSIYDLWNSINDLWNSTWFMEFLKCSHLWNSINHLWNSINDLWKSINHLWIIWNSIIGWHLWNSINDLWNSIIECHLWNSIIDLWNSINHLMKFHNCTHMIAHMESVNQMMWPFPGVSLRGPKWKLGVGRIEAYKWTYIIYNFIQ